LIEIKSIILKVKLHFKNKFGFERFSWPKLNNKNITRHNQKSRFYLVYNYYQDLSVSFLDFVYIQQQKIVG
jgi:hypothetical protein